MGFWHTEVLPIHGNINMTLLVDMHTPQARDVTRGTIEGRQQAHHFIEGFRQVGPGMDEQAWCPSKGWRNQMPYGATRIMPAYIALDGTAGAVLSWSLA